MPNIEKVRSIKAEAEGRIETARRSREITSTLSHVHFEDVSVWYAIRDLADAVIELAQEAS